MIPVKRELKVERELPQKKTWFVETKMDTPSHASSESEGWLTDDDADEADAGLGSLDSLTTGSSCCSSPTPRSSPKRSPLFTKKV